MGNSYRRITALAVTEKILKHLADQREPSVAADISKALDIPTGTVMCHLSTLEDFGWVRRVGEHWVIGMALAIYWAKQRAYLEGGIARMQNDLNKIGV